MEKIEPSPFLLLYFTDRIDYSTGTTVKVFETEKTPSLVCTLGSYHATLAGIVGFTSAEINFKFECITSIHICITIKICNAWIVVGTGIVEIMSSKIRLEYGCIRTINIIIKIEISITCAHCNCIIYGHSVRGNLNIVNSS